jgi:hypothetical protein
MVGLTARVHWKDRWTTVPPAPAGPRGDAGKVTPGTLFRGAGAANRTGPYLSEFLDKDVFLPPMWVPQRVRTVVAGIDFLTARDAWLAVQNGALSGVVRFDEHPRHLRNGRDLGEYVHPDFSYEAALDACLILQKIAGEWRRARRATGSAAADQRPPSTACPHPTRSRRPGRAPPGHPAPPEGPPPRGLPASSSRIAASSVSGPASRFAAHLELRAVNAGLDRQPVRRPATARQHSPREADQR